MPPQGGYTDPYAPDPYATGQYPAADPYGGYGGQGQQQYDAQGFPVGQYQPQPPPQGGYADPYAPDPYAATTGQYPAADPYGGGYGVPEQRQYDTGGFPVGQYAQPQQPTGYADPYGTGQQPPVEQPPAEQPPVEQTTGQQSTGQRSAPAAGRPQSAAPRGGQRATVPRQGGGGAAGEADSEFTFVDDAEESEDVIDWLKFAETRSERRDERRRRVRNRVIALVVVLVLAVAGGAGYLWKTGAFGGADDVAVPGGKREVIVVHLHDLKGTTTTALLVDDAAGGKGSALLVPGTLLLPSDGGDSGSTTLGHSLDDQGAGGTRDSLTTVLGAPISGTWRLDTPYLQILVDQLGGITLDSDARITQGGKTLVAAGKSQDLNGQAAVAYATYLGAGEQPAAQLARFGQVLDAVLKVMPTDAVSATGTVKRMNAVMDPSLSEQQLGATLAALAKDSGAGHFAVRTLPVKADGTVDENGAGALVKEVLGGTVHNADVGSGPARVAVQDGTGAKGRADDAQVQVVNSGYTFVPPIGKAAAPVDRTEIRYTDDARAQAAKQLALTLGLPKSAVKKVTSAQTADIVVVLGKDYQGRPKTDQ
ncbi:LytR C-terminal domain-containing protein [Streptomyces sp. NPDC092296]|uniref:LCP family protein n=1 Tax=Streptomyces sp. NPDC092296 TaxID=3366012 RepID=UPI00381A89A0